VLDPARSFHIGARYRPWCRAFEHAEALGYGLVTMDLLMADAGATFDRVRASAAGRSICASTWISSTRRRRPACTPTWRRHACEGQYPARCEDFDPVACDINR
jgi:hypothetical protein